MNPTLCSRGSAVAHSLVLLSVLMRGASAGTARGEALADGADPQPVVRIGAVAYAPSAVTVFEGIKRYLVRHGLPADYVLYSNYDALVDALDRGDVDIAWNTPLAHARFHARRGGSQPLVMRDVDFDFRAVLVARSDSGIVSPGDLAGKTLVLGSCEAAEATVLPRYYLEREGVELARVCIVDLDQERDFRGNPCCSPEHVLAAVRARRGDAGIISEQLWKHVSETRGDRDLVTIWTSPPFSHCVFTARADFDSRLASSFISLMTAMRPDDPECAEVMRLEGTRRWLPGSPEGFKDLVAAIAGR